VVLLVVAGLVVALIANGDDDSEDPSGAPGDQADPAGVVSAVFDAAEADDCDAVEDLITDRLKATDVCGLQEWQLIADGALRAEVGMAEVDGDTATVPVDVTSGSATVRYDFTLVRDDDEWEVDDFHEVGQVPSVPSESPSPNDPTPSTIAPSDSPTEDSTQGSSPDDFDDGTPEAGVAAFLEAAIDSDCVAAEKLVTPRYLEENGNCDTDSPPPSDFTYQIKAAQITGGSATVPVVLSMGGAADPTIFMMKKIDDDWLIDDIEE